MSYQPSPNILSTPFGNLAPIVQDGLVQQTIKLSLQQNLLFGAEFDEDKEEWVNHIGQTITQARSGPLPIKDEPSNPKEDPEYKIQKYEETLASISPYRDGIKFDMLENVVKLLGSFANDMNELGKNAANTLNAVRRKALFSGYLGGHAVALATPGAPTTTMRVNCINGFKKQLNSDGKWLDTSSANPKPIQIGDATFALVTGVAADDPVTFPNGRGTLTLSANATWLINDAVVAMDAPYRIYQGGGVTNDAIALGDKLTLDSIRQAIAIHENNGIPRHRDGTWWVHLGPFSKPQLWADPEFQNVIRGAVETTVFANYTLHKVMGCTFIENNQMPNRANAGALQNSRLSSTVGKLSKGIYAEIVNTNGVELAHTLVTGGGLGKTWYMPQKQLASAAGLNASEFYGMTVTSDNMSMVVDAMVRFLIAAPTDDMRQQVPANWQFIGSFMLWNDQYGGSYSPSNDPLVTRNPYYKRAIPITHSAA